MFLIATARARLLAEVKRNSNHYSKVCRMSHFLYGKPARRHLRKGVWLRVLSLPKNILSLIGELKCANELIEWVDNNF